MTRAERISSAVKALSEARARESFDHGSDDSPAAPSARRDGPVTAAERSDAERLVAPSQGTAQASPPDSAPDPELPQMQGGPLPIKNAR